MNHTEGKVEYQEKSDAYTHIIRDSKGRMIACTPQGSVGKEEADARRLVACWNEHDGLVHDNAQLYQSLQGEMQGRLKAEKERDELVKALRKVVDWNDKYPSNRVFSHSAIVRIAKEMDEISNETRAILARYDEKQQATV